MGYGNPNWKFLALTSALVIRLKRMAPGAFRSNTCLSIPQLLIFARKIRIKLRRTRFWENKPPATKSGRMFAARSGGSRQIGELGVALAVRSARGLAAVAESPEIAWIPGRPAARAFREVDDRDFPVDGLPIGKIGGEGRASVQDGGARKGSSVLVHFMLCNWERPRPRARKAT
jgi:hypothetical protein